MAIIGPEMIAKAGTERAHQMALFAWAALNAERFPELKWMFAIKNQEKGGAIRGSMAKAEGVRAGVSDVFLPVARKGCHGLFIEMKKPGGVPRPEQLVFGDHVMAQGYGFLICETWEAAVDSIVRYLS